MRSMTAIHRVIAAAAFMCTAPIAHATLIGDEVACTFGPSSFLLCDPGSATVSDPGVEFALKDGADTERLAIDLTAHSISLSVPEGSGAISFGLSTLRLFDLDWVGFPDAELADAVLVNTNVAGFDQSHIDVFATEIRIDMTSTSWFSGQSIAEIALRGEHIPAPEPATVVLIGIGLVGLIFVKMDGRLGRGGRPITEPMTPPA